MSQYTTNTIADLDDEGSSLSNLYYKDSDVVVSELETTVTVGRYKQSLTSLAFGSTAEISIPNQDFLSDVYLHLQTPTLPPGAALSSQWSYSAIKSLRYQWGSSNVSQVSISGESLYMRNFKQAETKEKRDLVGNLAGTLQLGNNLTSPIAAQDGLILLPTPWSMLSTDDKKKPYDTSLLTSNILIQIVFEESTSFISVNSAVVLPNAFLKGEILLKQETLTDKSKSLRNTLKNNANIMSQFPYVHQQDGTQRYLNNINIEQEVKVDLNSFITSDLLGLIFYVVPTRDIKRTGTSMADYTGIVNKFNMLDCTDIKLEYNGAVLMDLPARMSELMEVSMGHGSITGNYAGLAYTDPNTSAFAATQHMYYLPFTQNKSLHFSQKYNNTARYSQQTLSLTFTPSLPAQTDLVLYTTYLYNGIAASHDGVNTITYS